MSKIDVTFSSWEEALTFGYMAFDYGLKWEWGREDLYSAMLGEEPEQTLWIATIYV